MRLEVGMTAPMFTAEALSGKRVDLAALRGRTVLIKFYRFATCPVCNLHMHRFIKEYGALEALGLTTVVLYHSPADKLESAQPTIAPFDLVADPEKAIFRKYGVETGWAGMFSPAVMLDYTRALIAGFPPGLLTSICAWIRYVPTPSPSDKPGTVWRLVVNVSELDAPLVLRPVL